MVNKKTQGSPKLIIKGNDFINARHQLSVAEMRIVLMMIAQIQRDDEEFKPYRIYIKDFADAVGTLHKGEYERAREITSNLMKRVMEIPKENGYLQISFLSSAEYTRGTGYVELSFDPKLKPHLLKLKERFTQYDIRNVLSLQSFYSIRIYELLRQYSRIGERLMSVDELKNILKLPASYHHYASFKRRIILQAQRDLAKHTDIAFSFEEQKTGRKVTHILFLIKGARQGRPMAVGDETLSERSLDTIVDTELAQRLREEFGFTRAQAENALKQHEAIYIRENLAVVEKRLAAGRVKELTPYTLKALAEDFRAAEAAKQKRQQKLNQAKEERQKGLVDTDTDEAQLLSFEKSRDDALKRLRADMPLEQLLEGFDTYLAQTNRFALDFAKQEVEKQGKVFHLGEQITHKLIESAFKTFLAQTYLPDELHSFEAWQANSRP
jgi:plasmid replication initiation protein